MGSAVYYNGILLDRTQVRVQRRAVMSGPQRLYDLWTLHVRGSYSPGYIAYGSTPAPRDRNNAAAQVAALIGLGAGIPQAAGQIPARANVAGIAANADLLVRGQPARALTPAATTDVAIRHTLMQPRKRLVFAVGPFIVLDVPAPPFVVDCANGPTPVSADVVEVHGLKSFLVDFVITTAVNEVQRTNRRPAGGGAKPVTGPTSPYLVSPLLVHEWSQESDVDQDFFATLVTTGRAVFRSDVLAQKKLTADQLRYWIGPPVPAGFNRQGIWVRQLSDGLTLEYRVTDRQRAVPYDPNILTRFEGVYSRDIRQEGLESVLGMVGRGWASGGVGGAAIAAAPALIAMLAPDIRRGLGQLLPEVFGGGGGDFNAGAFNGHLAGVPMVDHHLTLRGWGHPTRPVQAINVELMRLAAQMFNIFGVRVDELAIGDRRVQLGGRLERTIYDMAGKFVEYHLTFKGSLLQSLAFLFRPQPGNLELLPPGLDVPERPILAHPMRGTWLGALAAQALRDNDTPWDQQALPADVNDVNRPARQSLEQLNGIGQP